MMYNNKDLRKLLSSELQYPNRGQQALIFKVIYMNDMLTAEPLTRGDQHYFQTEQTLESVRQELDAHGFAVVEAWFRSDNKTRKILVLGPDPRYDGTDNRSWFTCQVKNGVDGLVAGRLFVDDEFGSIVIAN